MASMRDKYGNFPHGAPGGHGAASFVFGAGTGHAHQTHLKKEHHGIHRSRSSSSSSSEDDGMGGRRKKDKKKNKNTGETEEHKGIIDKIKEKLPGRQSEYDAYV